MVSDNLSAAAAREQPASVVIGSVHVPEVTTRTSRVGAAVGGGGVGAAVGGGGVGAAVGGAVGAEVGSIPR